MVGWKKTKAIVPFIIHVDLIDVYVDLAKK